MKTKKVLSLSVSIHCIVYYHLRVGRLSFLLLLPIWVCKKGVLLSKEVSPLWVWSSPKGGGSLERDSSPKGGDSPEEGDQQLFLIAENPVAQPATTMLNVLCNDLDL